MEIKNLDTFIQVAELCSFTRAAQKLGYSQSTVSFQIRQLEESLGIQLFERVNHTVTLTRKGREVLTYAHRIQILQDELERNLRGKNEVSGRIKIAMADSLCSWIFGKNYPLFYEKYPDVKVKILTGSTEDMFSKLDHNEVDLVYTMDNHIYNKDYVIASEDRVSCHFVTGMKTVLPVNEKHLRLEDVVKCPCVMTEKGMSYRKPIDDLLAGKSLEIDPILETGDVQLICQLVASGMGISFLPDFISEEYISRKMLRVLQVENLEVDIWKQVLYHKDKWISPAMRVMIDFLTQDRWGTDNV